MYTIRGIPKKYAGADLGYVPLSGEITTIQKAFVDFVGFAGVGGGAGNLQENAPSLPHAFKHILGLLSQRGSSSSPPPSPSPPKGKSHSQVDRDAAKVHLVPGEETMG